MYRPSAIAPDKEREINRYVNLIPNHTRRKYAIAYVAWLRGGAIGHEPSRGNLSYVGAEETRKQIRAMEPWG